MEDEVPSLVEVEEIPQLEPASAATTDLQRGPSGDAGPSSLKRDDEDESGKDLYERRKVPLTLLTGYLGAGKSTLLEWLESGLTKSYILTADHGYKIAVCMNDFGDTTDIESSALTLTDPLTGEQSTEFLSLPNGCLCCSFKDMGMAAVEEMAHKQGVDWVMVELTGLADPGPIAKGFWENEEMGDLVLDGVVCVVDCRNVLKQLADLPQEGGTSNEAQRQIACADVLLLNKTDLVDADRIEEVERTIQAINPTTRIHRTQQSRIPLDAMFNIQSFSDTALGAAETSTWKTSSTGQKHDHVHEHDTTCTDLGACSAGTASNNALAPPQALHDASISSTLIPLPPLTQTSFDKLNDFLETILWTDKLPSSMDPSGSVLSNQGVEVLRTKGLIRLDSEQGEGRKEYVLQGVTDIFELKEVKDKSAQVDEVQGKVVFIGRRVDVLKGKLEECLQL